MDAIVLAGGGSRRMGADKATLMIDGERLVDRVVRRLRPLEGRILLACGRPGRVGPGEWEEVADVLPGAGPLAGLVAGLQVVDGPLAAVVAVDHPSPDVALLRRLRDRWDGGSVAVVPEVAGGLQPLHAVWATEAADALRRRLEAGQRGVLGAVEALGAQVIDVAGGPWARDLDTPADVAAGAWKG